jgi:hypothetical protein
MTTRNDTYRALRAAVHVRSEAFQARVLAEMRKRGIPDPPERPLIIKGKPPTITV